MIQKSEESIVDQIKEYLSFIAGPLEVKEVGPIFEEISLSLQ